MARRDDLRAAQRAITNALAQHASFSHRASSAVVNRLHDEIDKLSRQLVATLADRLDGLTEAEMQAFLSGRYSTSRLKALRAEIDGWGAALSQVISEEWAKSGQQLAAYESAFAAKVVHSALDDMPKVKLSPEKLFKQAMEKPLMGRLIKNMIRDTGPAQADRVMARIRQGIAAGESNPQLIRALRGTRALQYQDGLVNLAKRDVERFIRTARNHVANASYEQTYAELGVQYVKRSAQLEGRTCKACAALDGKVYKIDEPKPEATLHPNCRCQYIPSLDDDVVGNRPYVRALKVKGRDGESKFRSIGNMTKKQREEAGLKVGQVKASTTYSSWFANQDAAYQKEWLGPQRYKLYKEGKYPLDRFIDPMGREYTLLELRQRDAETFRQVFGDPP